MVRWITIVIALAGGLTLGGNRATAQDERPGDVEPLTAIVYVVDCPFEGADPSGCASVGSVAIDVLADGVPVEGSGGLTSELTQGFNGLSVLLPTAGASITASAPGVTVTILTADLVLGACENGVTCAFIRLVRVVDEPSTALTSVAVVVANCPFADADVSDLCTRVEGAVVHVTASGTDFAGTSATTALTPIGVQAFIDVPVGATLTLTVEPNGDGYGPASGYDPLTISPESFLLGGCGGESRCNYIYLIEVPVDDAAEEPADDEPVVEVPTPDVDDAPTGVTGGETGLVGGEVVTRLPSTGVGSVRGDGGLDPTALGLMLAWPVIAGLAIIAIGAALRRTHSTS